MKKFKLFLVLLSLFCMQASALSPYENKLQSDDKQRLGLIAFAKLEQLTELKNLAKSIEQQTMDKTPKGIDKLSIYFKPLKQKVMVFAYFESDDKSIQGWEHRLTNSSPQLKQFSERLTPHSRANKQDVWLRMEWMNLVASDKTFPHNKAAQRMGFMSRLKPEFELQYRQLHQLNWPGVVDGMVKSNYRNWTSFLIEDGDALLLFTFAEYIGSDIKADNQKMAADPTTQRWWTHTEECLINLHGEGNWSSMTPLLGVSK